MHRLMKFLIIRWMLYHQSVCLGKWCSFYFYFPGKGLLACAYDIVVEVVELVSKMLIQWGSSDTCFENCFVCFVKSVVIIQLLTGDFSSIGSPTNNISSRSMVNLVGHALLLKGTHYKNTRSLD